ncbi:MAG: N-acetyltransferase [Cytophagales bacterium]|nr:N-acetyltransferase [Cytophagales bacterium]
MNINIGKVNNNEFYQTEYLTRETFWNLYNPGCTEHLMLHNLRNSNAYVEQLDLIALHQGEIIGHIISTKAKVVDHHNREHEILYVGPFSIDFELRNKGIGTQLLHREIEAAKKMGFNGMILFGNPGYYQRFGFRNALEYKITTKDGLNFEPFMVLELPEHGLFNVQGKFLEDKAVEIHQGELSRFEDQLPAKEKGEPRYKIHD